ncbi:hypothetical protein ACOME3_007207 [Neoechinorhynchus agilis]
MGPCVNCGGNDKAFKRWRTFKPKKPEENNEWFNRSRVREYMPTLEVDPPVSRDERIHDNIKIIEALEAMIKQIQFLTERIEERDRVISELKEVSNMMREIVSSKSELKEEIKLLDVNTADGGKTDPINKQEWGSKNNLNHNSSPLVFHAMDRLSKMGLIL